MGAGLSQSRQPSPPQDIAEFRKLNGPLDQFIIPEVPAKRKVTDKNFTITFAVFLVLLLPFLIYTFVNTDLDRLIHGYDKCGNVCGKNNSAVEGISCTGRDMSRKPFLQYSDETFQSNYRRENDVLLGDCVASCGSNEILVMHRCFPASDNQEDDFKHDGDFLADVAEDINKSAGYIVGLCFIGLGLSIGMLLLFRYFVAVVVWVILIGSLLGIIALTIFFWHLYLTAQSQDSSFFLSIAGIFSVISLILVIVLICMFKRIKLVIRLFKEAIRVIFSMPLILCEPLLTFLSTAILLIVFVFFLLLISASGFLEKAGFEVYEYRPNVVIMFTLWYHVVMCLWMSQFIIGCQHMVISGAVSAYYFARDKSTVVSPIYTSFYNLVRYHLGTVAFGSLIITVIAIIKALIRSLANNKHMKLLVDCCLGALEDFLKFLSKNAYIQTAMHGQPFFKSGKRAVRLLYANALSTIAVNSVGDFVLFMARLLIIVLTIVFGLLMNNPDIRHFWAAIVIGALVTTFIANCFFSVFETAIDTIFLCFCEDNSMNDGMERPYYMTTDLMQYMEEAKRNVKNKN